MGSITKSLKGYLEALGGTPSEERTSTTIKRVLKSIVVQQGGEVDPKDSVPDLIDKMGEQVE